MSRVLNGAPLCLRVIPTVLDIAELPPDKLPPKVAVPPLKKRFDVVIRPPGSKSITNRALLLAALADGTSVLRGALLDAEDSQVMIRALTQLGANIEVERTPEDVAIGNATLRVTGVDGRWRPRERNPTLNLANAGTATRFLAAAAILSDPAMGPVTIDGNERMRQRPIGELVEVLWRIGISVQYARREGYPPIIVGALPQSHPSSVEFGQTTSGQFVSAIMLVAPFVPGGLTIRLREPPTSAPYVEMTYQLLASRLRLQVDGMSPRWSHGKPNELTIPRQTLPAFEFSIEPDFSGATYFWSAAAITPGARAGIDAKADEHVQFLQGDGDFIEELRDGFGATIDVIRGDICCTGAPALAAPSMAINLSPMPDTAMTAMAIAALATSSSDNPSAVTAIRGLRTLRVKETDRIAAMQTELAKINVRVNPFGYEDELDRPDEAVRITPPPAGIDCSPTAPLVEFDTYNDHRMAMSLALIGLRRPNVVIRDPGCVRKTYPTFWRDLAKLYQ